MAKVTGYKPCEECGAPARIYQNRAERTRFCSRVCANKYKAKLAGIKSAEDARKRRADTKQPKTYRLVPLTKGGVSKVSLEDYDLAGSNWVLTEKGYARRTIKVGGHKKNERMHVVIMQRMLGRKLHPGEHVDHENRRRLDNRRKNLRLASYALNNRNTTRKHRYSRGVFIGHHSSNFVAHIKLDGKRIHIGTFPTQEAAAYAYDQVALQLHGEFASTNFDLK